EAFYKLTFTHARQNPICTLKQEKESTYLACSLGRPLSQTLHGLTGIMGYSRNIRAHALYSETFGASKVVSTLDGDDE
ncbi:14847_t:CDS:2, partial [Funneliformis mosseae]